MMQLQTATSLRNPAVLRGNLRGNLKGIGKLGITPCADPISCGVSAALQLSGTVIGYLQQQSLNNANKVRATQEAEGFVQIFYGATSASCAIKNPDGSAVWQYQEPQNYLRSLTHLPVSSPRFCESTISGLIERCRLTEARYLLGQAAQSGQQLAAQFSYFSRWWYQYGQNDIAFLATFINDAIGLCGGMDLSNLISGGGGGGGITPGGLGLDTTTILMVGGVGLLLFIMMMS